MEDVIKLYCSRARKALRVVGLFDNWLSVCLHIMFNRPLEQLRLRDGTSIHGPVGLELWNHFNDIWEYQTYTSGDYRLEGNWTVVDIGANIGLFSLFASRRTERVYSFEPSAEYFSYLRNNIQSNDISNVECFNLAVCNKSGKRRLYALEGSKTGDSMFHEGENKDTAAVDVECITLPEIMSRYRIAQLDFLKLDCEGCEYEVLLELPSEHLSRIRNISLEYHTHLGKRTHQDIVDRLEAHGFCVDTARGQGCFGIIRARAVS